MDQESDIHLHSFVKTNNVVWWSFEFQVIVIILWYPRFVSPVSFETWSLGHTVSQDHPSIILNQISTWDPCRPTGETLLFSTLAPNMFSGMGQSRRPWKRKWTKWLTSSRIERPRWCRWTWRRLGVLGSGFDGRFHGSITVIIASTFIDLITIISTIIEIITIIIISIIFFMILMII